jgi:uncharacterized Rmd1/YagE family protein
MRCTAYCTAASYSTVPLLELLRNNFIATAYRDAIHIAYSPEAGDVFFFSYGVVVFWGLTEEEELQLIEKVKPVQNEPIDKVERDRFNFNYGESNKIHQDEIVLQTRDVLTKLAISYGLAQSVKLAVFEEKINKTIKNTKHLPKDLAEKGKIFLSRKEISQKIGALFIERNSVNLHTDILDSPEFFWEYSEFEALYRAIATYLELANRVEVLNKRLDIVRELFEMLNTQLNHQHSSTLEWTIIWLIVIEVVLAALKDVFHIL